MDGRQPTTLTPPSWSFDRERADTLLIKLEGSWTIGQPLPSSSELEEALETGLKAQRFGFRTDGLAEWDSVLLAFLIKVQNFCSRRGITAELKGLPEGVRRLLSLATAVPERKGAARQAARTSFLSKVGTTAVSFATSTLDMLAFIGEAFVAFIRMLGGKANYRRSDLLRVFQETGAEALPIVSLISLLVGLILAFVGAVQLKMFGAQIYVASLVGVAMVRVMGAIMTGIIMAGRTGAAFAAELGTMQVNEEIDALKTLGISPMEFLVLPRIVALAIMMPLLCLYADLMGILGGLIVGVFMLDLNPVEYFNTTREALTLTFLWVGLFHSAVFGVLVALSGCMRGMQCGRSASGVGVAVTSAVVTGIVSIIVATAFITVVCDVIGI
jgi:phospholipid/cholesterol/gamma-HCH transport system permease protein